jgi:hypothetical protein
MPVDDGLLDIMDVVFHFEARDFARRINTWTVKFKSPRDKSSERKLKPMFGMNTARFGGSWMECRNGRDS